MSRQIGLWPVYNGEVLPACLLFWTAVIKTHSFTACRGLCAKQHSLWALLGDKKETHTHTSQAGTLIICWQFR